MPALLDYRFWLDPNPVPLGPSLVTSLLVFFGWFLVLAVALAVGAAWLAKRDALLAALLRRGANMLAWTGLLGWLCLFFAYEQAPFLGMRLWFIAVGMYFLARLIPLVIAAVRDYPHRKAELAEREAREKYLPHRK